MLLLYEQRVCGYAPKVAPPIFASATLR